MIELSNGGRLIESLDELPRPESIDTLYADFETTSGDDALDALNPWHHCWTAGVAFTFDDHPGAWYAPVGHRFGVNLPLQPFADWWLWTLSRSRRWCNHNVKYDAHVSANSLGVVPTLIMSCTQNRAKLIDSDRGFKGGYGLDALSLAWLGHDIRHLERDLRARLGKSKDYGSVRALDMAQYACEDAMTVRRLDKYETAMLPPESKAIAAVEEELTGVLFDMERSGLRVRPTELMMAELEITREIIDLEVEIMREVGRPINPGSNEDVFDVLCNQYGLPVMAYTKDQETGEDTVNPSFDKHAMKKYEEHPFAPVKTVRAIATCRRLNTRRSLFVRKYIDLHVDGLLHSNYNQCMRTGRLGCKDPNSQQLDKWAKGLIVPGEGESILSADQSQIEFRVIVHYIEDRDCIKAYLRDPDTDFHQYVADMAGMPRRPAKTLNFQNGYGGGKKLCVKALRTSPDVIGNMRAEAERLATGDGVMALFEKLCTQNAERVYDDYHRLLPTLKPTSRFAARVCKERGYVRTLSGRRRHLPPEHAHNAFNSVCQGTAADIQKERTVALARAIRGTPIRMIANVHDEVVLRGPTEVMRDRRTQVAVARLLESPLWRLSVPLRANVGVSESHWREASTDFKDGGPARPLTYTEEEASADPSDALAHLRR